MSNEAITWAFKQSLPMNEKFVLVSLADYADENNSCFPSMKKTAERIGCSPQTVRTLVKKLEARGLVEVQPREHEHGGSKSNRYVLAVGGQNIRPPIKSQGEGVKQARGGGSNGLEGEGQTVLSTVTLNEPLNEPSNEPVGAQSAFKGRRVPENFMPAQKHIDKIRQLKPNLNLDIEHTKFMNHWLSSTGRNATKKDWGRAWENWMLNAREERQEYKPGWQKRLEYNAQQHQQYQQGGDAWLNQLEA